MQYYPNEIFKKLRKVSLKTVATNLVPYGGTKLLVIGKCKLRVKAGKKRIINLNKNVGIHSVSTKSSLDILDSFQDVLNGLGHVKGKYDIKLDTNVTPTVQSPRKILLSTPHKLKKKLVKIRSV